MAPTYLIWGWQAFRQGLEASLPHYQMQVASRITFPWPGQRCRFYDDTMLASFIGSSHIHAYNKLGNAKIEQNRSNETYGTWATP